VEPVARVRVAAPQRLEHQHRPPQRPPQLRRALVIQWSTTARSGRSGAAFRARIRSAGTGLRLTRGSGA
jgi:hypothetical protein